MNLRHAPREIKTKYLSAAHKIVKGMEEVASLHFSLSNFDRETGKALKVALRNNPGICNVFFYDRSSQMPLTEIISELIHTPSQIVYYVDIRALSQLSVDLLDSSPLGQDPKIIRSKGSKTIIPLPSDYVGTRDSKVKNYKAICQSPYASLFKVSYVDFVNEKEQKALLVKILEEENSIELQLENMKEILQKEEGKYKALPLYFEDLMAIDKILKEQLLLENGDQTYYAHLEEEKKERIKAVLDRMG